MFFQAQMFRKYIMDSHLPDVYNFFKYHTALIIELFDAIMILKI